jgi:hypothetical protein
VTLVVGEPLATAAAVRVWLNAWGDFACATMAQIERVR